MQVFPPGSPSVMFKTSPVPHYQIPGEASFAVFCVFPQDSNAQFFRAGKRFRVPELSVDEGHDNILLEIAELLPEKIKAANEFGIRLVADPYGNRALGGEGKAA